MVNSIVEFLNGIFPPEVTELLVAMLPFVELRGAIPIGVMSGFPLWKAALIGFVGTCIPVVFILLLLKPVIRVMKRIKWIAGFGDFLEGLFRKKADKAANDARAGIDESAETGLSSAEKAIINRREFIGIILFVGVPLPMTGAWTGSAIASFLQMPFKKALPAVIIGVAIQCAIMTLITWLFAAYVDMIILVLFAAIAIMIITAIVLKLINKKKPSQNTASETDATDE